MESITNYYDLTGPSNTEATLNLSLKRAKELGIKKIVIATTTGDTAIKAAKIFKGFELIVITHTTGFKNNNEQEVSDVNIQEIESYGAKIYTGTHAFGGVCRAVRRSFNTYMIGDLMAETLKMFGQGMKVAVEIAAMAADAGLVRIDRDIISIGGTGRGADTAIVVQPANTHDIFTLRVKEIICKPR